MMQTSTCISLQIMSYGTSVLRSYNVELCKKMCENKFFDNLHLCAKGQKLLVLVLVFVLCSFDLQKQSKMYTEQCISGFADM